MIGTHTHQSTNGCYTHSKEYITYCKTHQVPLCDTCQHEHFVDQTPMIAGGHYQIQQANHDLVKIDKFLQENVEQMDKQLHSFSIFT